MSNEQDLVASPQPVTEPSTNKRMSRIRFFKILSSFPAKYDAILGAYDRAPQMPAIQIPRAAIFTGDKVEVTDIDIPDDDAWQNLSNEPILRSDGTRVLTRAGEVVAVFQSRPEDNNKAVVSSHDADLANNRYLKKAA